MVTGQQEHKDRKRESVLGLMSKSQVGLVEQPREYSMVNPETVTARCYFIDKKTVLRKNMTFLLLKMLKF